MRSIGETGGSAELRREKGVVGVDVFPGTGEVCVLVRLGDFVAGERSGGGIGEVAQEEDNEEEKDDFRHGDAGGGAIIVNGDMRPRI